MQVTRKLHPENPLNCDNVKNEEKAVAQISNGDIVKYDKLDTTRCRHCPLDSCYRWWWEDTETEISSLYLKYMGIVYITVETF